MAMVCHGGFPFECAECELPYHHRILGFGHE
eukprot:CAMPEP_0201695678 /NCGR_PEP_ID=MMETSP0578-20130828/7555_1 /ASSEMBLY_ACC=CAM_ASM_000663 /TAXON_ID=267565 /ORGANISM="Skeletonema grethea, Strain CCMP 1804" /LENGTH=30 /DNA_ID= /DNA_START= /DNA_END= /DNA_ORIENTATION=